MDSLRLNRWILMGGSLLMVVGLLLSGWAPFDRTTWLLEVFPVMVVVPLLLLTRHHYPLTTLLYLAIFLHGIVLMVGGAYSYARVPLGFALADWLELSQSLRQDWSPLSGTGTGTGDPGDPVTGTLCAGQEDARFCDCLCGAGHQCQLRVD